MRMFLALMAMLICMVMPAVAQDDMPWQASISGQIEALRSSDGEAALGFAGQGFRTPFEGKPDAFLAAIAGSGYGPIVESRSHSFGEFNKVGESVVMQVVKFVGPDQSLYEALYQMADEPDEGWRVQGVVLRKEAGIGI